MSLVHLHLALAHLPVILVPLGFVFFLVGQFRGHKTLIQSGLVLWVAALVFAVIVYLLGEDAEEAVENIEGVLNSNIETHENMAGFALGSVIILGVMSIGYFYYALKHEASRFMLCLVLLLGLISSVLLGMTAQFGGAIRHPEAFKTQN